MMATQEASQPREDGHEANAEREKDERPRPELLIVVVSERLGRRYHYYITLHKIKLSSE